MKKLNFVWKATLNNGRVISQYDEEGNEVLFKEVRKNLENLVTFRIESKDNFYEVDLENGTTNDNGVITRHLPDERPELIYFRRNKITMGADNNKVEQHTVVHHIGMKYEDIRAVTEVEDGNRNNSI